jgi:pimeloyl-ACP methyl ester carboxylesterase
LEGFAIGLEPGHRSHPLNRDYEKVSESGHIFLVREFSLLFCSPWNDLAADKTRALPVADREAYVAAYSRPGRMRAGWAYFAAWPDTAKDFAQMAQTQLTMPVLSIAGEKASAAILGPQMKRVATNVTVIDLKDAGHWLMEERPQETMKALIDFL